MSNIVYFSTRYPKPLRESIIKNISFSDSASAVVFSDAIFNGLVACNVSFVNVNVPPLGYWLKMNSQLWSSSVRCTENEIDVRNVGMINMYILREISIYFKTYREIKNVLKGNPAVCFVYAVNIPVVRAILRYRRRHSPSTKLIMLIPDFIEDMYSDGTLKSRIKHFFDGNVEELYKQVDGFIYLTEQMKERTMSSSPYRVIEGIYDQFNEQYIAPDFSTSVKNIFYSGKLDHKFGLRRLVDAFSLIKDDAARLVLCGSGDCEEYIKSCAHSDKRIMFKGQLPREECIRLQSQSKLLINPRTPEGEFTRYSFPSKNIQYLASGIPTLMYRLDGIPQEYYKYCLTIEAEDLSVESLSKAIQDGINMSNTRSKEMGVAARRFILKHKNAQVQCKKIIDLITELQS